MTCCLVLKKCCRYCWKKFCFWYWRLPSFVNMERNVPGREKRTGNAECGRYSGFREFTIREYMDLLVSLRLDIVPEKISCQKGYVAKNRRGYIQITSRILWENEGFVNGFKKFIKSFRKVRETVIDQRT